MQTSTPRAPRHEHPGEDRIPPLLAEHPQMEIATQATDIMFRGLETMRGIQERAAKESFARHSKVNGKMKPPVEPARLMLAHAQLLSEDVNAAAHCWQEIGAVALEMQAQLAACCTEMIDTDKVLEAAASLGHPSA